MGQTVEFPSNGATCPGYLGVPDSTGPGVVVIQEWWGLVDHVREICDRLAEEGFVALAPDLYRGESTTEPDEAGKKMMALNLAEAVKDMTSAIDFLLDRPIVEPKRIGTVGFCMGGTLALLLGAVRPLDAVVAYYPAPFADPDLSGMRGPVLAHLAGDDEFRSLEDARRLIGRLRESGIEVEDYVYEGTHHAFFNDHRPEVHDPEAAATSWDRTLTFLRRNLAR